ncbi:MAG: hypothetical protein J6C05_02295 [Prevotella sp.]|nr:hypothetical protein [Prevotella sp.]
MAKRRILKANIKLACGELFNECIAMSLYNKVNIDNTTTLLQSIVKVQNDYVGRVSHVESGMSAKEYFKSLIDSFNAQTVEIVDQINNLN